MDARLVLVATLLISSASGQRLVIPLGLDAHLPAPAENPLQPERVALGRKLFSDTRLSRDNRVSCASCHDPKRAFTDDRPLAVGVFQRQGPRRVPSIVNRGYGRSFFWDGRIQTLEEQVLQPIQNDKEMDLTLDEAQARTGIPAREISLALAGYVRTILAGGSPYDKYLSGERGALTEEQRRGLEIFRGKGNCTDCHLGPNLTDERFHNTGVAWRGGRFADDGRFLVTKNEADRGAFKTPTLREVARRPPYMHDGSLPTLEAVVEFYSRGGNANPNLAPEVAPLHLTPEEKRALVAFLGALTGAVREGM